MSAKERGKVDLHFISNTHWDREWRYSMQRTRHMLVEMLDMLFDIFEKEPEFKSFHMDSQSVPLTDYLEIRPEMEERVRKYVREGRFLVGPWFCLPDEYCVGGESLIRNLLLGHKIAEKFGPVSKTGYSPFGWGQISQMPQIYQGFGINMMSFYRGVNTLVAPKSEFIWEGPDGTRIYASRLARRPRYNVWYIVQRPAYWNERNVDNRHLQWNSGLGQFKFVTEGMELLDYQYIHPTFDYHAETVPERVKQALEEQDRDWSQPHRFWSAGHDNSTPDIREVRMIADIQKALGQDGTIFHSTVKEWQDAVIESATDLPVVAGEMRHTSTEGSSSDLIGWITSSRTQIKQANFATERMIGNYAEPMAVFAGFLGAEYPQGFIDLAYNWLLQNHGHDSIAGCGRDILEYDVLNRLSQSREISGCVTERAMMDIASSIDFKPLDAELALMVYNPAPFARTEVMEIILEIPDCWNCKGFDILDENGNKLAVQIRDKSAGTKVMTQSPNDVANFQVAAEYRASVEFTDVPGMGYRCFKVAPVVKPKPENPVSMVTGARRMANEFLEVTINANGTYDILDKNTGKTQKNLGWFKDSSEVGDPWKRVPVANESIFTTLNESAEVSLARDGELETVFKVRIPWRLPAGANGDETARDERFNSYTIENTLTLRKGQPWLDVVTSLSNNCESHYLQVGFPTDIRAEYACAQGQFDVVKRPMKRPDYSLYTEIPMTEAPMNSFVDVSDGETGFGLLNEGLKAYEASPERDGDALYLSLLRCYPLRMCVTEHDLTDYSATDKGSQCPGPHTFRYAVMPHRGDWQTAGLWRAAERFNLAFQAAETAPTEIGREPLAKSFLEFTKDGLHVSAVKRAEDGDGWVVRLFNPFDETFACKMRVNGGLTGPKTFYSPVERLQARGALPESKGEAWAKVREVTLEELPVREMAMDGDGWIDLEVMKKKIVTVKLA